MNALIASCFRHDALAKDIQVWSRPDERLTLGHVAQKWKQFCDDNMLKHFEMERVLFDLMMPSKRNALQQEPRPMKQGGVFVFKPSC